MKSMKRGLIIPLIMGVLLFSSMSFVSAQVFKDNGGLACNAFDVGNLEGLGEPDPGMEWAECSELLTFCDVIHGEEIREKVEGFCQVPIGSGEEKFVVEEVIIEEEIITEESSIVETIRHQSSN